MSRDLIFRNPGGKAARVGNVLLFHRKRASPWKLAAVGLGSVGSGYRRDGGDGGAQPRPGAAARFLLWSQSPWLLGGRGSYISPACVPAEGDLFLSPDICSVESNGAAPSEAQIPAPVLPLALGPRPGQAPSQPVALLMLPQACPLTAPFPWGPAPSLHHAIPKAAAHSGDPAGHEATGISSFLRTGI